MRQAIVTGYDWLTGRAYVTIPGGPANIPCVMLNRIPGPRSLVWIDREDTSMPIVLGVEGPTSWILHDHFTYVDVTVGGITNNGKYGGDTSWWAKVGTAATGSITGDGTNGTGDTLSKIGQIKLSTGNVIGQYATLQKDPVGDSAPNAATWLSARIALPQLANTAFEMGFSDAALAAVFGAPAAGFRDVSIEYDSTKGANFQLRVGADGTAVSTDTGVAAVANRFIDVDLMYVPSYWAGLWIDGAMVASTTANVPAPNVTTPISFRVFPRAASAVAVIVDVIHVETIGTVSLP